MGSVGAGGARLPASSISVAYSDDSVFFPTRSGSPAAVPRSRPCGVSARGSISGLTDSFLCHETVTQRLVPGLPCGWHFAVYKAASQLSADFISITTLRGRPGRGPPPGEMRKPPIRLDGLALCQGHATSRGQSGSETRAQASLGRPIPCLCLLNCWETRSP